MITLSTSSPRSKRASARSERRRRFYPSLRMFVQDRGVAYDPAFAPPAGARADDRSEADSAPPAGIPLVMPMAGRGSRFAAGGETLPKPLVQLAGRPFFWWAVESVRRIAPLTEAVFVVLEDHVRRFAIDEAVRTHYPDARIV